MPHFHDNALIGASGQGVTGYNLTKSLRMRGSASGALTRTPATTGNQRTFTWSGWVKRGSLGTNTLFDAFYGGSTRYDVFYFTSSDTIRFFGGVYSTGASTTTSVDLVTTQVFRDPSAWYHIVLAVDTTQATAANRVKLYVNGSQVTSFSTSTYPAQNDQTYYNVTTTGMSIGSDTANSFTFDGYMADVYSIDGQQLTPSSFGETDTITGVWKPKRYTGTYGTNGFYLPFTDVATTSGSNAGLGKDFSGNGNYWNTNNISVTSGATYDSMTDVPTLTSATAANYAVMNPLDKVSGTTSNGNLTWTATAAQSGIRGTVAIPSSGAFYMECTVGITTGAAIGVSFGLASAGVPLDTAGGYAGLYQFYASSGGQINLNNTTITTSLGAFNAGDVLQVAVDATNTKMWLGKNNTWYDGSGGTTGNPSTGANPTTTASMVGLFPFSNCYQENVNWNFGQRAYTYTPPTGYVALNTYNLPDSTIVAGNTVMDVATWTGTGATSQSVTNAAGFKPDFVWTKSRSNSYWNALFDSNRGRQYGFSSNSTNAETTSPSNTDLVSFDSNGFTVGPDSGWNVNASGATFVGWQWQAGQGTTSSNTAGSITSTVSANPTAGFSIVTYTSPSGGATAYTVGHGLGVAPSLVISKERNVSGIWSVYHASTGDGRLQLQSTAAVTTGVWTTLPTSTTFWQGSSYADGSQRVAYCWAEIAGFSKFGSFVGNGSTDGTFVYTGFKPKFLMIKASSTTGNWNIVDTTRNTSNVIGELLYADAADAGATYTLVDSLSNGFKLRNAGGNINNSGTTFIYMAFAENPFKNSLAR